MSPIRTIATTFFFAALLSLTPGYSCEIPMVVEQTSSLHLTLDHKNALDVVSRILKNTAPTHNDLEEVDLKCDVHSLKYHEGKSLFKLESPLKISFQNNDFLITVITATKYTQRDHQDRFKNTIHHTTANSKDGFSYFFSEFKEKFEKLNTQCDKGSYAVNMSHLSAGGSTLYFSNTGIDGNKLASLQKHFFDTFSSFQYSEISKISFKGQALRVLPANFDLKMGAVIEFEIGSLQDYVKHKYNRIDGVYSLVLAGKLI